MLSACRHLLVILAMMASALVTNITSNKYIVISQRTCAIHDEKNTITTKFDTRTIS